MPSSPPSIGLSRGISPRKAKERAISISSYGWSSFFLSLRVCRSAGDLLLANGALVAAVWFPQTGGGVASTKIVGASTPRLFPR